MTTSPNPNWEFDLETDRLYALGSYESDGTVGRYGDRDEVAQWRWSRRDEIVARLQLAPGDRVLDLGSGLGYIAEAVAPLVASVHCADISSSFLAECRRRIGHLGNVEFTQIPYADLSELRDQGIGKVYSTLLFIHFNFYDIYFYLLELSRLLPIDGTLYFDYNDGDRFSTVQTADSFHEHLRIYPENREHWVFGCMHMSSYTVLNRLAPQLGFELVANWASPTVVSQLLLRKVGDPAPIPPAAPSY